MGTTLAAMKTKAAMNLTHSEMNRVSIISETSVVTAGMTNYRFQLMDTKTNTPVTNRDLVNSHEKILHLLAYDPALKEFQHVHPEFIEQEWRVELNFSVNGKYWIWAQGELALDSEDFSTSNRLTVLGGRNAWPTPPVLSNERLGVSGISKVELGLNKITANKMSMLKVTFTHTDGTQVQIEPYLGAFSHIVAVPEGGDSILHVHPMPGSQPNEGMIHTTFPKAGSYRIWIQFIDDGNLKIVPLSVKVF